VLSEKKILNETKNHNPPPPPCKLNGRFLNAEHFKIGPVLAADALHPVFHKIWEKAVIPNSWSEGNIIRIPKSGDLTNCNNWRGITLLSIPSKVFRIVLISRITEAVDKKLRQEQAGFRKVEVA
jgi:hypothetical protein